MIPWIIEAMPGQQIELSIIDFGSEFLKLDNRTQTEVIYGYIVDSNSRIPFKPTATRQRLLHTSKTNNLRIELTPLSERQGLNFLIQYQSKYKYL